MQEENASGQRSYRAYLRCLCDAWRSSGQRCDSRSPTCRDEEKRLGFRRLSLGLLAYAIVRDTTEEANAELRRITDVKQNAAGFRELSAVAFRYATRARVSLEDYSVSNRGLRSGLIGSPQQVSDQAKRFEDAGVDPPPDAVQSSIRRNGATRRRGHPGSVGAEIIMSAESEQHVARRSTPQTIHPRIQEMSRSLGRGSKRC